MSSVEVLLPVSAAESLRKAASSGPHTLPNKIRKRLEKARPPIDREEMTNQQRRSLSSLERSGDFRLVIAPTEVVACALDEASIHRKESLLLLAKLVDQAWAHAERGVQNSLESANDLKTRSFDADKIWSFVRGGLPGLKK